MDEYQNKFKNKNIFQKFVELFYLLQLFKQLCTQKIFLFLFGYFITATPSINLKVDINKLNRKQQDDSESAITDLLFDLPSSYGIGRPFAYSYLGDGYEVNVGYGYLFNEEPVKKFCKDNNIYFIIIIRSDLVEEGSEYFFENKLITIWPSPNYLNYCNKACVIELDEHMNINLKIFKGNKNDEEENK